nr:RNA-directed DNA polymerase, eukaryota, reverse transcriptase zinc-binding domain protein [Tanacetum cinerariifolium]
GYVYLELFHSERWQWNDSVQKEASIVEKVICVWVADLKRNQSARIRELKAKLIYIDKLLDLENLSPTTVLSLFQIYHSWFSLVGFEQMVTSTWNSFTMEDGNGMIRFKKKLQLLKKVIRGWVADLKRNQSARIHELKAKLIDIDKLLDLGIMVEGEWVDDPCRVKEEFQAHFANRFQDPDTLIFCDEIRVAVWACGENKSPGPDGLVGFEQMVTSTWNSFILEDGNGMIRFKKKLQLLKKVIRGWVADLKRNQSASIRELKAKLIDIDKLLDLGKVSDDILLSHMEAMKQLQEINSSDSRDFMQNVKIRWAIEGDENSKFFHGVISRKRANLSVKGIMVEGKWVDDPCRVKEEFQAHFANRFQDPVVFRAWFVR